jgi:hypothetical protein
MISYKFSCVDGFDEATGICLFDEFADVSEFGCREEEVRNGLEEGRDLLIPFKDFKALCLGDSSWLKEEWEYYIYPSRNRRRRYTWRMTQRPMFIISGHE